MSVPNTETFTLQDVVNELGGGETSLQACFDNAAPSGFDSTYNNDSYAPANSMLRFRNYSNIPEVDVVMTSPVVFFNAGGRVEGGVTLKVYEAGTTTPVSPTSDIDIDFDTVNLMGFGESNGKTVAINGVDTLYVSIAILPPSATPPYNVTLSIALNNISEYSVNILGTPAVVEYTGP